LQLAIAAVIAALAVVAVIAGYLISQEGDRTSRYYAAVAMMEQGQYEQAKLALEELGDYNDAQELAAQCLKGMDYTAAGDLLAAGDYAGAEAAYLALGDFLDAPDMVVYSQQAAEYAAIEAVYNSGDVASARPAFAALAEAGFAPAQEAVKFCDYSLADQLLAQGYNYQAHLAFQALGDFQDSAERAGACQPDIPVDSVLWYNNDIGGSDSAIRIDCSYTDKPLFFKIYFEGSPVATLFVNAGGAVSVDVQPGNYSISVGGGNTWWGNGDAFGPEGIYLNLTFGTSGSFYLSRNITETIAISTSPSAGDDIGTNSIGYESF